MRFRIIQVLVLFLFLAPGIHSLGQATNVFIVRHAEKNMTDTSNHNPPLSKEGEKRAKDLKKKLRDIKLDAIFSTNTIRTESTAKPTAEAKKLTIQTYDARNLKALAEEIKTKYAGKNVLVVGHSNTLLPTVQALGGITIMSTVPDNVYDLFFKVSIDATGKVDVMQEIYGKKTPAKGEATMK